MTLLHSRIALEHAVIEVGREPSILQSHSVCESGAPEVHLSLERQVLQVDRNACCRANEHELAKVIVLRPTRAGQLGQKRRKLLLELKISLPVEIETMKYADARRVNGKVAL